MIKNSKQHRNIFFLSVVFISSISITTTAKDILFCTKDIDLMQSSPASVTGSNPDNLGNIDMQAYFPLENDKHNSFNLRHCFVAFAKVEKVEGSILSLKQVQTYGYGANPNPQEYAKTGDSYQEIGLDQKVVSCVFVLNSSTLDNPREINGKWAEITAIMDDETEAENYNTVGHNCCSVAYYAVKQVSGDLSQVNPKNFNLNGMGIIWGQTFGNITDYLTVSTFNGMAFWAKTRDLSLFSSGKSANLSSSSEHQEGDL